jgi:YegS/Rv2252/BmrU family lipid kinase
MHCKKASLVINPRTGQNLANLSDVLAVLAAAGWKTDIAIKEYGGHSMELARQAAENKSDLIVAYGGDGTLNQVINGVMNAARPRSIVGVIPGGTANLWAGDIGAPSDPVLAALSLVNSEPRKVDVGLVSVQEITFPDGQRKAVKSSKKLISKARHHFLLMAGLGLDAAVMSGVSKSLKYRVGPLAIGVSAAKELPGHAPFPIEIRAADDKGKDELLWQGEAVQVVVGNTRRYAIILEMTPEAYIDDGILDVCVITGGDPISTMQQLSSLILRRKPDNVNTEFFRGAHLSIKVPASVLLELDGSFIKLKDYLSKADYGAIQQTHDEDHVMVTYRFDALPAALDIAIPCTYDGDLFENRNGHGESHTHGERQSEAVHERAEATKKEGAPEQTSLQEHTLVHETQALSDGEDEKKHSKRQQEEAKPLPELVSALLERGRKVTVVGKAPDPDKPQTYIIAGHTTRQPSGDNRPVAVVVNGKTALFDHDGQRVSLASLEQQLREGAEIVVEGSKSRWGVISASRVVL